MPQAARRPLRRSHDRGQHASTEGSGTHGRQRAPTEGSGHPRKAAGTHGRQRHSSLSLAADKGDISGAGFAAHHDRGSKAALFAANDPRSWLVLRAESLTSRGQSSRDARGPGYGTKGALGNAGKGAPRNAAAPGWVPRECGALGPERPECGGTRLGAPGNAAAPGWGYPGNAAAPGPERPGMRRHQTRSARECGTRDSRQPGTAIPRCPRERKRLWDCVKGGPGVTRPEGRRVPCTD
jgi:hypothetical protein